MVTPNREQTTMATRNPYWQMVLDQSLIITIGALDLSLVYGFAGQFSLGHAAFCGLGAYPTGVIDKLWGHGVFPFFLFSLLAGAAVGRVFSPCSPVCHFAPAGPTAELQADPRAPGAYLRKIA